MIALISILTAVSCLEIFCFFMSAWLQLPMVCPIESWRGQIGHFLCCYMPIKFSRLLLPSVPVLHLSIVPFIFSVMFGILQKASLCVLSL